MELEDKNELENDAEVALILKVASSSVACGSDTSATATKFTSHLSSPAHKTEDVNF